MADSEIAGTEGGGATLTPRRVPEAHIRAEVASFPLTDRWAFDHAVLAMHPLLSEPHGAGARTGELWRECERVLVAQALGWSLDRIIAIRDQFWFPEPRQGQGPERPTIPMHRYLRHLAAAHLEARPVSTIVKQSSDASGYEALTHYRWLAFAMPEDLLLTALPVKPPPSQVEVDPPMLIRRLLDDGVAEIHQHVSAGMDFPMMWASVLAALAGPDLPENAINSPGLPFDDGTLMVRWLLAAAITRCVLGWYLVGRQSGGHTEDVAQYIEDLGKRKAWDHQRRWTLTRALRALACGNKKQLPPFHPMRALYGDMHPTMALAPPRLSSVEQLWRCCDPIAVRLQLGTPNGGERWLVRHGLEYLEDGERQDRFDGLFARLFWQTLRLRCLYYRTIVQRPMTAGLQWFVRFQARLNPLNSPLLPVRSEISFSVAGHDQPIRALEGRFIPGESPSELASQLLNLVRPWQDVQRRTRDPPELGVVLHFAKDRDFGGHWTLGKPPARAMRSYGVPPTRSRFHPTWGRYGEYFGRQAVRARAVRDLFRMVPETLWLMRGIDVASDELAIPTWVLVPLYRLIQRQAALASATRTGQRAPLLRTTAHTGEDFRHLMEGLRRVFEAVMYLLDRMGGRLGHGTALGLEPRLWAESVGTTMMPIEERLWDLVFEWRLYSGYRVPPEFRASAPSGRSGQVENGIRELSERMFCQAAEPHHMAELHHLLHHLFVPPTAFSESDGTLDSFMRSRDRVNWRHVRFVEPVCKLLGAYRDDPAVFRRGQRLIDIPLDTSEIAALYAVQNAMRGALSRRGVVVEVNPSSNLLIADLQDLRNHPILRLYPPEPFPGAPPPVHIAVGSDDPITFDTHLLREYTLLADAASAAGFSGAVVQDWLGRVRQTGMNARFTVPWPRGLIFKLVGALERYLQLSRRHPSITV